MGVIDEVKRMQSQGKSQEEIRVSLQQQGLSEANISSAISQAQIKDAVGGTPKVGGQSNYQMDTSNQSGGQGNSTPQQTSNAPTPGDSYQGSGSTRPSFGESYLPINSEMGGGQQGSYGGGQQGSYGGGQQGYGGQYQDPYGGSYGGGTSQQPSGEYEGMQPSMLGQEQQEGGIQEYGNDAYGGYGSYQPYGESISSDVISEVAEQIVSERLSILQDKLESAVDFRNVAETRLASLDNRLKRIENVLDVLQVSLLQKVGEYVNDVSDLKSELIETQKSVHAIAKGPHHTHKEKKHHP